MPGEIILDYLFVAGGLLALVIGGEALVRGAVGIAVRLAMPPLLIGLTVVGFGTSTPELLVSLDAALRGVPDIALGNVVGSNIANVLLIVGLTALVAPIRVSGASLARDASVMVAAGLVLVAPFALGLVGRGSGLLLLAGLAGYLYWCFRDPGDAAPVLDAKAAPVWRSALWVVAGLAGLMLGARFLVDGAIGIARDWGLSEAFIGLTIVAVGTSLPELATSLVAAFRRQSEIAIGNVVGSNIFNALGILGATAVVAPVPVAGRFLHLDLPVMITVSALLAWLLITRPVIGRGVGVVLVVAYAVYVWGAQG